jgi:hypothetical protein
LYFIVKLIDELFGINIPKPKMSDCPICFEVINETQNVVITECRHKFHATCLFRTTQSGVYRCPNCRGGLLSTDSSAATGATGSSPATTMAATTGATGPMGTSGPIVYHGTGATASYYYQDISSNILHAMMSRTSVTYHNDSSDDESSVQGG